MAFWDFLKRMTPQSQSDSTISTGTSGNGFGGGGGQSYGPAPIISSFPGQGQGANLNPSVPSNYQSSTLGARSIQNGKVTNYPIVNGKVQPLQAPITPSPKPNVPGGSGTPSAGSTPSTGGLNANGGVSGGGPSPSNRGGDLGGGYATLIDPKTGTRVPVQVGSQLAKDYFSKGFVLEKSPGQAGGTVTPGSPTGVDFQPNGIIKSSDVKSAYENPATLPDFFGTMFEGVQNTEANLTATRMAQNSNVQDLTASRQAEGLTSATSELNAVNSRIADFNATVENIQNDVRRDLGPGVSESFVQAEVQRRTQDLQAEGNRLLQEQAAAQAKLQMTVDRTTERFNALRADAAEKVNIVAQKLGFDTENINMATSLFTNMKNFEILSDQQQSAKRDAARATLSLLLSTPASLKNLNSQQLATLEANAEMPAGTLQDIRDSVLSAGTMIAQNIDDKGNLNMLFFDPRTNSYTNKRWDAFAVVVPKASATSTANAKLYSSMSTEARSLFANASAVLNQISAGSPGENVTIGGKTMTKTQAATALRSYVQQQVLANPNMANADVQYFNSVFTDQVGKAAGEPDTFSSALGRTLGTSEGNIQAAADTAGALTP